MGCASEQTSNQAKDFKAVKQTEERGGGVKSRRLLQLNIELQGWERLGGWVGAAVGVVTDATMLRSPAAASA